MKASELIRRLQALIEEHGDLNVVNVDNDEPTLDYNTYPDPAFVVE